MKPFNFAHRGYSGKYPENTMLSFERAVTEGGCDGLEIDVQLTADAEPVVIHDANLKRITGISRMVYDCPFEELRTLDAAAWHTGQFPAQRIPHLREVLTFVRQNDLLLNIELKNYEIPYIGLEEKVIHLVLQAGLEEQVLLSSFNHRSMVKCKRIQPGIATGLLYMQPLYRAEIYCKICNADALHPSLKMLEWDPGLAGRCEQQGLTVAIWTVNTQEEMEKAAAFGAEIIITDYPDRLSQLLQKRAEHGHTP